MISTTEASTAGQVRFPEMTRAIAALVLFFFAGGWLLAWAIPVLGADAGAVKGLVAGLVLLLIFAGKNYYKVRKSIGVAVLDPTKTLKKRMFVINATQWVAIFLAMMLLRRFGYPQWIVPAVMLVIGLHFLPMAALFSYRPHYVTGYFLAIVAIAYPFIAPDGAANPVGRLLAGAILMASALWAMKPSNRA